MKISNKKDFIIEEMKLSIIKAFYKPRERLLERELAAQFKTSRPTIREAIRKLETIGLVQVIPNRGARVADFSPEEMEGLYLVRNNLEQLEITLAINNISSREIKAMSDINQDLIQAASCSGTAKILEKNFEFHQTLTRCSRNPFLIQVVDGLRSKCYLSSYFYWKNPKNMDISIAEHEKIIKALSEKDEKQLLLLANKHLNNGKNNYLEYLSQRRKLESIAI